MWKKKQPPPNSGVIATFKDLDEKWGLTVFDKTSKKLRASLYSIELLECV